MSAYRDLKGASEALKERHLAVEAIWSKTALQVTFVKRVAKVLEEEHCRIHLEVLKMLNYKLSMAISKIESVTKKGSQSGVQKWKYVWVREAIDEAISQLQQWQSLFDPTWYLILRMGNTLIDEELSKSSTTADTPPNSTQQIWPCLKPTESTLEVAQGLRNTLKGEGTADMHVTLPEDGLDWHSLEAIEHSATSLVRKRGSSKIFIIDTIDCSSNYDVSGLRSDVENMAKKLRRDGIAAFGLLSCKGVIKRKDQKTRRLASMNLAFNFPGFETNTYPTSLRSHLLRERSSSLSRVLDIACQLARAVSYIHTFEFVHKNIRPETVLVFPEHNSTSSSELGSAFLLGFDSFRHVNFHTLKVGDDAWERNLYRHPSRQGIQVQEAYIMQHDVYSLGVCLLELGLWESFVDYRTRAGERDPEKTPGTGVGLGGADFVFQPGDALQTSKIKDHLVNLAETRLPIRMGDKYAAVVITCLTCLDSDNEEFVEADMQDEDGILVGVRFIERVLLKLGNIVL